MRASSISSKDRPFVSTTLPLTYITARTQTRPNPRYTVLSPTLFTTLKKYNPITKLAICYNQEMHQLDSKLNFITFCHRRLIFDSKRIEANIHRKLTSNMEKNHFLPNEFPEIKPLLSLGFLRRKSQEVAVQVLDQHQERTITHNCTMKHGNKFQRLNIEKHKIYFL